MPRPYGIPMSTTNISIALRRLVVDRSGDRCEYCHMPQLFSSYNYEIDHVIAEKHKGETTADNLALACFLCNRYKGSDVASFDPLTGALTPLFNPRTQDWNEHFEVENGYIVGTTAVGRTTIVLLQFNNSVEVALRQMVIEQGQFLL